MKNLLPLAVFVLAFSAFCQAEEFTSYEGYKVYQILPKNEKDLLAVDVLGASERFDFWSDARKAGLPAVVMASPKRQIELERFLSKRSVTYSVLIENVERQFEAERQRQSKLTPMSINGKIQFDRYYSSDEINKYMESIAQEFPNVTTLEVAGKSYENRTIYALRISTNATVKKPAILIECGMHAREWIGPAMGLYLTEQLLRNQSYSKIVDSLDWYIILVANPDGYEYSRNKDRMWRKTRKPGRRCVGTDPNRNFDFHWNEAGTSNDECSLIYAGTQAFSEVEARVIRDYFFSKADQIRMTISFHSFGQYILYPWGHTRKPPQNEDELYTLGMEMNNAIAAVKGTEYEVGTSIEVLYSNTGTTVDWYMGVGNISLSYTYELPGGGSQGFDLPADRIEEVVTETIYGVDVAALYLIEKTSNELKKSQELFEHVEFHSVMNFKDIIYP